VEPALVHRSVLISVADPKVAAPLREATVRLDRPAGHTGISQGPESPIFDLAQPIFPREGHVACQHERGERR